MVEIIFCIALGYFLGMLSPSYLIGKSKNVNLKEEGTGNLGAMNTMLTIGKAWGVVVMLLDIGKAALAVKLAEMFFPEFSLAGIIAGASAIVGHNFPAYLKFKGGKGLAPFGGAVLALHPLIFLIGLVLGFIAMLIANFSAAMPMTVGIFFPIAYAFYTKDLAATLIAVFMSALIMIMHAGNLKKGIKGKDINSRGYLKNFFKKK